MKFSEKISFFLRKKKKEFNLSNNKDINYHLNTISLKYEESIIIGNGPSFNSFFLKNNSFLKRKNLFCVNSFINTKYFLDIKPSFCILIDPFYWRKEIPFNFIDEFKTSISILKNKVDWGITLILPEDAKNYNLFIDLPKLNSCINLVYFKNDNIGLDFDNSIYPKFEKFEKLPHFQNVLVAALFFSINFGSKINFLIGADMSLHQKIIVNEKNQLCTMPNHFYEEIESSMPIYKDNGIDVFKVSEYFYALSLMFKGFEIIKEYSDYKNSTIINLTENSFIDSFERSKI